MGSTTVRAMRHAYVVIAEMAALQVGALTPRNLSPTAHGKAHCLCSVELRRAVAVAYVRAETATTIGAHSCFSAKGFSSNRPRPVECKSAAANSVLILRFHDYLSA